MWITDFLKKRNKIFTSLTTFGDLKSAKVWFIKPLCWMKKTNTEKIRNCTKSKLNKCKATTEMKNSSSQSSYAWTSTLEDFNAMTETRTSFITSGKFVFFWPFSQNSETTWSGQLSCLYHWSHVFARSSSWHRSWVCRWWHVALLFSVDQCNYLDFP